MNYDFFSVTDLVEDFLLKRTAEDNSRDNSHFHPSEFAGCKRKIAYKYYVATGVLPLTLKEVFKPGLLRVFDNGHHVHYRWQGYLEDPRCAGSMFKGKWKCKNSYAHEHPQIYGKDTKLGILRPEKCECGCTEFHFMEVGFFDEDTMLGGHVDTILCTPTGQHIIIDYKSIKKYFFDKLYDTPKPEHNIQMHCYLFLSGLSLGKFIYECKDDQNLKEIDVPRNEDLISVIVEEAMTLKNIVTVPKSNGKRALPPRTNSLTQRMPNVINYTIDEDGGKPYECSSCPFKTICWK